MPQLIQDFFQLLLPRACAGCARGLATNQVLCRRCDASLTRLTPDLCPRCQTRNGDGAGRKCDACNVSADLLAGCQAAVAYESPVSDWIQRFKYPASGIRGLDAGSGAVVHALIREASRLAPGACPDAIVPVPLHPRRLRQRGFNPAMSLASAVGRERRTPVRPGALVRIRDTPSQTGLDRVERRRNLAGAFRRGPSGRMPPLVWLVDDVITTGSTLLEAARVLRRSGARCVVGICVARVMPGDRFQQPTSKTPRASQHVGC